uniref:Uncharacterized protein n=1 Tax=Meloidogyne enterolobii TaxID=390850 RepID=A0A6V7TMU1_MELEN|nr:unnamed protein product [Meloidogyne enterolobii]
MNKRKFVGVSLVLQQIYYFNQLTIKIKGKKYFMEDVEKIIILL